MSNYTPLVGSAATYSSAKRPASGPLDVPGASSRAGSVAAGPASVLVEMLA